LYFLINFLFQIYLGCLEFTLMKIYRNIGVFFLFLLPNIVSAQIIFTEVMYNPSGTDTGREWVEIFNTGTESVDITTLKLFEDSVNHKISAYSGINLLSTGQYAIIADNPEKFHADFNFDGIIFDSAFSLNNTGEEIKLINSAGSIVDTFNYSIELGGNDTGNSLQLNDVGWIPAVPTPGEINAADAVDENDEESEDDDNNVDENTTIDAGSGSVHNGQTDVIDYKPTAKLKVSAGRERFTTTNSEIFLELIHNQDKKSRIRAKWSMGDGHEISGKKISYIFDRPGEYNIVLNTFFGEETAISRTKIYVLEPEVKFSLANSGKGVDLLLKNSGKKELNIGGYTLKNNKRSFVLAADTIISAGQTLAMSETSTGLAHDDKIVVYFPNGDKLESF
jgi:hypothetical protein